LNDAARPLAATRCVADQHVQQTAIAEMDAIMLGDLEGELAGAGAAGTRSGTILDPVRPAAAFETIIWIVEVGINPGLEAPKRS
jgi:hypothetical protein